MNSSKRYSISAMMYDAVISPLLRSLRSAVVSSISAPSNILEIGCGTGELAMDLSGKISGFYTGIDSSPAMIAGALRKSPGDKITFICDDFLKLEDAKEYDYAIFPMILHSIGHESASRLLEKSCSLAHRIIIADYRVPRPGNWKGLAAAAIEKLAGKDHYEAFQWYIKSGGIAYYAGKPGLHREKTIDLEVFQVATFFHDGS